MTASTDRNTEPFGERQDESRGSGVGRRLVIGFVISCVLGGRCWGLLPRFGVWVPAWLPLGGFGLIMLASLIAGYENARDDENGSGGGGSGGRCGVDEGRPICCSGPRPMKMLRD